MFLQLQASNFFRTPILYKDIFRKNKTNCNNLNYTRFRLYLIHRGFRVYGSKCSNHVFIFQYLYRVIKGAYFELEISGIRVLMNKIQKVKRFHVHQIKRFNNNCLVFRSFYTKCIF